MGKFPTASLFIKNFMPREDLIIKKKTEPRLFFFQPPFKGESVAGIGHNLNVDPG